MALTLNQVISRLRTLALSHDQINNFYFGDPGEFDIKGGEGDVVYPCMFLELQPGTIDRVTKATTFNFRCYFLDKVGVSTATEENETEVLSDMSSVMQDYLSMLMFNDYQDTWQVVQTANYTHITEELGDMVAGVVCDIGILVDFLADRCQVPADDVEFENDIDMARTKIYTYTGTGSEGSSWAVPTLSGKHVLAIWRATQYKRAIATVPADTEKIQVGTTDVGNGKGILGDGTVTLSAGDILMPNEILDFLYYA